MITRRFYLLKRPGLYYAAAIVLVFGVPWQLISYKLLTPTMGPKVPLSLLQRLDEVLFYGRILAANFGWALTPFALVGIAVFLVRLCRGDRADLTLTGALALLLSVWIFHSALAIHESRYMVSAIPAVILLTIAGLDWVVRSMPVPGIPVATRSAVLGVIVAALVLAQSWAVPRKPHWGLDQAAHSLLSNKDYAGASFLIVANAAGEGAFISEVVTHDDRPDHFVLRSSKVLVNTSWFGANFQVLYPTTDGLLNFLDHAPISAVVLDTLAVEADSNSAQQAVDQLQQSVAQALASDATWQLGGSFPRDGDEASRIKVYTRIGPQPAGDVQLSMRYTLGSNLVVHNGNSEPANTSQASATYTVLAFRIIAIVALILLIILAVRRKPATPASA